MALSGVLCEPKTFMQLPSENSVDRLAENPALLPKLPPLVEMEISAEGQRRREAKKLYYLKNKARILEETRKWKLANKDKCIEMKRRFREVNRARVNAQSVALRRKNLKRSRLLGRLRYHNNREQKQAERREYYKRNSERERTKCREYGKRNRKRINDQRKLREGRDAAYAIGERLRRSLVKAVLRRNTMKADRTMALLGCPLPEFIKHLESQFVPGMGWHNRSEWEIDHIRPIASFDLLIEADQRECFHWSNLRPLWTAENRAKSDKFTRTPP